MDDRPRRTFWRRVLEALPMSPQDRDRRDDDGRDHAEYRTRRLRLRLLEKRGMGGYR